ncbi:MAG: hypothetical protein P8Y44_12895 [Acidobacteriota bacterium]
MSPAGARSGSHSRRPATHGSPNRCRGRQLCSRAEKDADAYKQEADAAAPLAIGTVVTALPSDCTTLSSGGQQYYQCGKNYFRAAFQGSQLVYVTTEEP